MRLITKFNSFFDRTIGLLAVLGAVILVGIMVIVDYEVVARYFLNSPTPWMLEIVEYALLYLTFLGAAWVLKEEGHIKMDLIVTRLNPKAELWLNIVTSIIGTVVCLIITWYGITVVLGLYHSGQYFAAYLKPPKYIIVAIVPFGTLLLSIQFIRRTYGYIKARESLNEK